MIKLEGQIAQLQLENKRLYSELVAAQQSAEVPCADTRANDAGSTETDDLLMSLYRLGKRYSLVERPWITASDLKILICPGTKDELDDPSSTLSTTSNVLTLRSVSDLFATLRGEWIPTLRGPTFRHHFFKGVDVFRDVFRPSIGTDIDAVQPKAVASATTLNRLKRLAGYNGSSAACPYDAYPPILYQGQVARTGGVGCFGNKLLAEALRRLIYGVSQGRPAIGWSWNLSGVTAGMIAWISIAAIYILSPDTAFEESGAQTHIPYHIRFTQYKDLLEEARRKDSGKHIFEVWDSIVLQDHPARDRRRLSEPIEVEDFTPDLNAIPDDDDDYTSGVNNGDAPEVAAGEVSSTARRKPQRQAPVCKLG
ncbi:hypothetical protein OBBRIDRAFT_831041 [Obba rivulosa]|uniref:Uncharacterized protein n=1 Tax=Obba rivulosa TaxID=1052685 RepID=A0A8E2DT86_9APHY|nr:hypothetical protein OBBRIDRAFT_831041 [Obba rivulosa]